MQTVLPALFETTQHLPLQIKVFRLQPLQFQKLFDPSPALERSNCAPRDGATADCDAQSVAVVDFESCSTRQPN